MKEKHGPKIMMVIEDTDAYLIVTDASELCHSNVIRRTIYWEMECYEVPWAVKRPLWVRLPECSKAHRFYTPFDITGPFATPQTLPAMRPPQCQSGEDHDHDHGVFWFRSDIVRRYVRVSRNLKAQKPRSLEHDNSLFMGMCPMPRFAGFAGYSRSLCSNAPIAKDILSCFG